MNVGKLREAEALFLMQYPGGFESDDLKQVVKRHNVGRLIEFAQASLGARQFTRPAQVLDSIVKIVARSSMVSMFEKPRFRDFVNGLGRSDRARMADAFEQLLHGNQAQGFDTLVELLELDRLAKWSLVTVCPFYYRPGDEVFVKPTTTKNVIRQYELDDLVYRPRPSWTFYARYRDAIQTMKTLVHPQLSPNNAAFTGFLMMTSAVGHPE